MTIKIAALARKNPQDLEKPVKYYAGKAYQGEVSLGELINLIVVSTNMDKNDVMKVINHFLDLIPTKLEEGKIIRLGKLGSFSISVHSAGVKSPEEFTVDKVKSVVPYFRCSKEFKKFVSNLPIEKTKY